MMIRMLGLMLIAVGVFAAEPVAEFADLATAQVAIIDDHLEPYFSTLQPLEMAAKTGSALSPGTVAEQQAECRKRYQAGVRAFTPDEQAAVTWYVAKARTLLATDYPAIEQTPWRYIKVDDHIEGGLPHTRGEYVVFAQGFLAELSMAKSMLPEDTAMQQMGDTVIHEHMHVVQRLHPEMFTSLYTDLWHLRRAPRIVDCPWLVEHHLANPDGVDCGWVFPVVANGTTRWIWPLVIFGEVQGIAHMPNDFDMAAISLSDNNGAFTVVTTAEGKPVYVNLMSVPEYARLYVGSHNIYHPNESAADLFAKIVIFDALVNKAAIPEKRLAAIEANVAPLRTWFKANSRAPQP